MREAIWAGIGLVVAQLLGRSCDRFLQISVTAEPASTLWKNLFTANGGGKQIGTLERLIFFASLLFGKYELAGAWLVFKVGTKWAVWQHVAKLPEDKESLSDRSQLSAKLYGRFVNGTSYNGLCAAVGVLVYKSALYILTERRVTDVPIGHWLMAVIVLVAVVVMVFGSLFNWHRDL